MISRMTVVGEMHFDSFYTSNDELNRDKEIHRAVYKNFGGFPPSFEITDELRINLIDSMALTGLFLLFCFKEGVSLSTIDKDKLENEMMGTLNIYFESYESNKREFEYYCKQNGYNLSFDKWYSFLRKFTVNLPSLDKIKPKYRKPIRPKDRITVFERDDYTCQICGRTVNDGVKLEVDHKIPVKHGGTNDIDNLQTLCRECNIGKGARLDLKCCKGV